VTTALETALEVLLELKAIHIQRDKIKVSIQGFGNVGSFTARFLDSAGIKVVAISDVSGLVSNKDGLNIPRLMIDMKGKSILSDLHSYDILDKNQIFEFDSDIFIPAAMGNVIIDETVTKLLDHGVKIIVEAANLPTSPKADEYLNSNGVWLIPDFLANAGGVIGSFVEYQGRTEKEAFDLIRYKISKNIKNILTQAIMNEENPRVLALEMSKQRVYRAMLLRKGAISVAREAYSRKDAISV
jgi:glutamate dehydrogenase (NAD(P)+)